MVAPDYLLIGVQKSGTTSLINTFNKHPNLAMCRKEVHFFDQRYELGPRWYEKTLDGARRSTGTSRCLIGEKSPSYCYLPFAIERIRLHYPRTKLILILREPIQRAFSQWCMFKRIGKPDGQKTFRQSIEQSQSTPLKDIRENGYWALQRGYYDEVLNFIWSKFPRTQVHVCISERVKKTPALEYNRMFRFLGVPSLSNVPVNFNIHRGTNKPVLSKDDVRFLRNIYRPHTEKLYTMLGYRVSEWEAYYKQVERKQQ